jgi:DNA-directed RNA polymerase subunit D
MSMEIKMLDKDKKSGRVSFMLLKSNPSFANALRRNMMDSVPTMAVEDVEFRKNNSILYDEIIAHRLGLLPLTTDLKSYTITSKCKCKGEGCARCTVKMTLASKSAGYVYASEIKSKDSKIKPVHPKTPIVKLLKGQEIEAEMTARLDTGREHSKWAPCLAYYKYKPVIDIDSAKCTNAEEVAESCPVDVYNVKNGKLAINNDNLLKCHLCGACAEKASKGSVKLNESDSDFIFFVEPWGQLKIKDIVAKAAEIFEDQLNELDEKLKKAK